MNKSIIEQHKEFLLELRGFIIGIGYGLNRKEDICFLEYPNRILNLLSDLQGDINE